MSEQEENYNLAKIGYTAYCDSSGWYSQYSKSNLPQFDDLKEETKNHWIKASEIIKKTVLESQEQYCFVQDESCHWFLLPIKYKKEFQELDEKGDWEGMEQFSDYMTGGGISDIYFSNPIE